MRNRTNEKKKKKEQFEAENDKAHSGFGQLYLDLLSLLDMLQNSFRHL